MLYENRLFKIVALFRNSSISQICVLALLVLPAGGLAASNTLYPGQIFPVGGRPLNTAVADLNGDGVPDIVTANYTAGSVSVVLSGSTGFSAAANYPAGAGLYDVELADVDGDGKTDIVAADLFSGAISVLLNTGTGGFGAASQFSTGARSVALGDVDNDGFPDAVTTDGNVFVLLNDGTGSFGVANSTGGSGGAVALADIDNDGNLDIVAAGFNAISVQLGNGDGTFDAATSDSVSTGQFEMLALGDVNGDGKVDAVVTSAGTDNLGILLGDGTGGFAAPQMYSTGSNPVGIGLADLDADGYLDAVTSNTDGDDVTVLLNNGSGSFAAPVPYAVGNNPYSLALGDMNSDGATDIVAANFRDGAVSIFFNSGTADFNTSTTASYAVGDTVNYVILVDVTADTELDMVTANLVGDTISVLPGDGAGGFGAAVNYPVGDAPRALAVGDVNNDGKADVVTANIISDNVSVLLADGSGGFAAPVDYSVGDGPRDVALADADNDGEPDIITANFGSDDVSILYGDDDGFDDAVHYADGNEPRAVSMADVNSDGLPDIITANAASEDISILLNNGSGFAAATAFDAGDGPTSFAVGDVNADGVPDIAIANFDSDNVSVLAGVGGGSFAAAVNYTVGDGPRGVELIDVNADSKLDILTANANGNTISILLGDGTGVFSAASIYLAGQDPISIAVSTINADSRPDIAVANENDDSVSVLLQNNVAPIASGSALIVEQDRVASASLSAFDLNSDKLLFNIQAQPNSGVLTLIDAAKGQYNYVPATGFYGHDSFTFKASDGDAASSEKTVSITVEKAAEPAENAGGGAMSWPILVLLALAGFRKFKLTIMQGMNAMRIVLVLLLAGFTVQAQAAKVECVDDGAGGFEANGHACKNVDLLSHMTIADLGGSDDLIEWVSDMWGWVDDKGTPENPADDREYAIVGRFCGTSFVDITDPENPVYLGNLPDHSEFVTGHNACAALEPHPKTSSLRANKMHESDGSIWRDIKVYGHYAIIVAETNIGDDAPQAGMQIFDLHQLRGLAPAAIPVQFQRESYTHYDGFGNSHNVFINPLTALVYAVGSSECQGGPHIVDISDPANPVQANCFGDLGYTHDIHCVIYHGPDATYVGREICVGSNGNQGGPNTLAVLDVTDPANVTVIANPTYDNPAYSHQAWFSEDHRYVYHNDELDEEYGALGAFGSPNPIPKTRLLVWDVADLDNPVQVTQYPGRTGATDHNNYVQGDYLYQSNYTAGLNILDLSDPINPVEAGFFDNFIPYDVADYTGSTPPGDEEVFDGTWSNYPWYPSGTVGISDITGGLYLVEPDFGDPARIVVANVNVSARAIDEEFEEAGEIVRFEVIVENNGPEVTNHLNAIVRLDSVAVDSFEAPAGLNCTLPSSTVLLCKDLELAAGETYVVEVTAVTGSEPVVTATAFSTAWNVDITKTDNTDEAMAQKEGFDGDDEGDDEDEDEDEDDDDDDDDGGGSGGLLIIAALLGLGLLRRR